MRGLLNLFLLLFLADGCLSLLDEIVSLISPFPALSVLRGLVASVVIVVSVAVYFSLGVDRRVPKRVFLPLILLVWFCPFSVWLFPRLGHATFYGLFTAVVQMLLFLVVTARYNKGGGGIPLMPEGALHGRFFDWKNTLAFGAANVLILPGLLVLLLLSSADSWTQRYTSGFMHVRPDGLHMAEKVYRRGNKTVRLIAMIHVGEKQYYDGVLQQHPAGRTIVLAEGVTDDKHLLHDRLDYGAMAGYLGLASQREQMLYKGRLIEDEQLDDGDSEQPTDRTNLQPDILRADVDISSFRPATLWFLQELSKQMKKGKNLREQMLGCMHWWDSNVTPEMQEVIFDDLLQRRNLELIRHFDSAVKHYDTIVVPWGAMHMAAIEPEVLKQGFRLQQVQDRVSIHFLPQQRGAGKPAGK